MGKWVIGGLLLMLGAGLAGCRLTPGGAGEEVAPAPPADPIDLVGELTELQGAYPLKVISAPGPYGPGEIGELAGERELLLRDNDFVQGVTGEFQFFDLPGLTFAVTIYQMASPHGARRVYQAVAPFGDSCLHLGEENRQSPLGVAFHRDVYYVELVGRNVDERLSREITMLAAELDNHLQR
ncbi:MAG TPA: hypothetical protein PLY66_03665 [Acidobacteriota bacterium]|nr:hypothetical protein [Acidobacteriota bacterium]HQF87752.1 hypothetical protein [Acidobacteriota bacterium]HQG92468.1 hypothetical protein [Acidobacteriota bacterium]HQK87707.1 hypothetical protein [Acidobacteriota bacterium]